MFDTQNDLPVVFALYALQKQGSFGWSVTRSRAGLPARQILPSSEAAAARDRSSGREPVSGSRPCACRPAGYGLPLEHRAMDPAEGPVLTHLEPPTWRFTEHVKHGRPRDDPHDRPAAAWVATNIHGMGRCRGHRARRGDRGR